MRDDHVRLRWLADRRDGRLHGARAAEVEAHLASGCAECAGSVARLDRTVTAFREGPLPEAPRALVRGARRLFVAQSWARVLAAPAELFARLLHDQRLEAVPALRSAVGSSRRMLWAVGAHELDLEIAAGPSGIDVRGQFLPADDDGTSRVEGSVTAWRDGRAVAAAALDDEGRFGIDGLPAGVYALTGEVAGRSFRAMPIVLDEESGGGV